MEKRQRNECYKYFKMKGLTYIGTVEEQEGCSPTGKKLWFNIQRPSFAAEIQNSQKDRNTFTAM
jgi:hypothetical protein